MKIRLITIVLMMATSLQFGGNVFAQGELAEQMAQLRSQRSAVANGETRVRVPALYYGDWKTYGAKVGEWVTFEHTQSMRHSSFELRSIITVDNLPSFPGPKMAQWTLK